MSRVIAWLRESVAPEDVLSGAGILAVGAGVWQIAPPVALVVIGLALLYLGLWHGPLMARLHRRQ